MRKMMMGAAAALAVATPAAAEEACYDVAVVGHLMDYVNEQPLGSPPQIPDVGMFPRVRTEALIMTRKVVKGPEQPRYVWARSVMTEVPPLAAPLLIYLKNQPDGVPAMVGYRHRGPWGWDDPLNPYPAC